MFVIAFLMGVIVGSDREEQTVEPPHLQYEEVEGEHHEQDDLPASDLAHNNHHPSIESHAINEEIPDKLTHKLAALLANGFHHIYELIIDFLYEVASLFF